MHINFSLSLLLSPYLYELIISSSVLSFLFPVLFISCISFYYRYFGSYKCLMYVYLICEVNFMMLAVWRRKYFFFFYVDVRRIFSEVHLFSYVFSVFIFPTLIYNTFVIFSFDWVDINYSGCLGTLVLDYSYIVLSFYSPVIDNTCIYVFRTCFIIDVIRSLYILFTTDWL